MFRFPIQSSYPPVVSLDLHLEGENEIIFNTTDTNDKIEKKGYKNTQLTAFFKMCDRDSFTRTLLYQDMPNHYIFDAPTAQ
ncbi:hypothetical protein Pmani_020523 [Petrolisthes manimaculis]|uniref:Uncharacterized protein n=1 Tax=Petrolisthes manimaculis TaxID=1843537 RepID=A0AAE1PGM0_9EUCA|nr:hypothetical protein Pmani_020523 [Petrolisthes manimaculis]